MARDSNDLFREHVDTIEGLMLGISVKVPSESVASQTKER